MARFRLETFIAAPPERVFDLARDLDFHQRSLADTGETIVGGRTGGLIELGEEVEWQARHLGRVWRLRSRVTVLERPQLFTDVQVHGPFASFEHRHRFEPVEGGTRMVDEWEHRAPLGWLGRVADWLFLSRHMVRLLETRNLALKREAEQGD
ncbi:SRPBCC family protein [Hyalangium versicolor]|uniref:SRPBCC family protein n=1 Tax=Hyalangium versicolor TaxID=2861190 RepID=UPI001CCB463E|nr:SRPBCC family protein [Hyalangium versicolor]